MNEHSENMALIRRYLLGETNENEGERVEKILLTDQVEFENALILEDELSDDYVQGFLSKSERLSFESNYATTKERRQKVWFARMLNTRAAGIANSVRERPERTWKDALWLVGINERFANRFAIAYLCVSVLMIILILSLVHQTANLKTELEKEQNRGREISAKTSDLDAQLLDEKSRADDLRRQLGGHDANRNSPNVRPLLTASLELLPGISRGPEGIQVLVVPQEVKFIEIDLKVLQEDYKQFRAELYDTAGREIAMQDLLQPVKRNAETVVSFKYPSEYLSAGGYKLQLKVADGRSDPILLGNYYFRIKHRS
jgi:hypothetical protein